MCYLGSKQHVRRGGTLSSSKGHGTLNLHTLIVPKYNGMVGPINSFFLLLFFSFCLKKNALTPLCYVSNFSLMLINLSTCLFLTMFIMEE